MTEDYVQDNVGLVCDQRCLIESTQGCLLAYGQVLVLQGSW